jgi:hypothetical protein
MRSTSLIHRAALIVALVGIATVINASPIVYMESGFASGAIGGSAFTNALVQVTASGDTANVVTLTFGTITFYANLSSLTRVTIAGIGTATVTDASAVYSFPAAIDIDPSHSFPVLPYVVIGTLDSPPSLDSFTGVGVQGDNALLGYDLKTAIGPITGIPGGIGHSTDFINTSLGHLSFTANISPTAQGTFTATLVPEPMSLLLLGSGIAVLAGISRFRPRS